MGLKGFLFEKELTLKFNDELHPSIWDNESDNAEPTLRSEIREKLLEIAKAWAEYANIPEKHIKNILFTGSLANYNYTDKSDIDLHVLVDYDAISKDFDFIYDYFKDKKLLWSHSHNITIKGFPVEMYAQPMSEKPHTNQGVYSVSSNKWIQAPKPVEIDPSGDVVFMKKLQSFKEQIDDILAGKGTTEGIEKLKEKLRNMRGAAIGKSGEFSQENLIFKELRNSEYLDKLTKYHREQVDKELSLESIKESAVLKARELKKKLKERLGESITDEPEQEEHGTKEDIARVEKFYKDLDIKLMKFRATNPSYNDSWLIGFDKSGKRNRPPKDGDTNIQALVKVGYSNLLEKKELIDFLKSEGIKYYRIESGYLYVSKNKWYDNWEPLPDLNESITDEPEQEENDYDTIERVVLEFIKKFPATKNNDSVRDILETITRIEKYKEKRKIPDIRLDWNELLIDGKYGNYFNYAMTNEENIRLGTSKGEEKKYVPYPYLKGYFVYKDFWEFYQKHKNYIEIDFEVGEEDQDNVTMLKWKYT